jgi:hypothetical protein
LRFISDRRSSGELSREEKRMLGSGGVVLVVSAAEEGLEENVRGGLDGEALVGGEEDIWGVDAARIEA